MSLPERCRLLLDADIFAYQFAAIGQQTVRWDEETTSTFHTKDLPVVIDELEARIEEYRAFLDADEVVVCLSVPTAEGWRKKLLPTYKDGRGEKPLYLAAVKDHLRKTRRTYERPTLEADDILGILSTHPRLLPGRRIVVSTDKDLKTIPGWLWNPQKDAKPRLVSEEEADYWHLYQTLTGDTTDNYKGCPGIGPKKAADILTWLQTEPTITTRVRTLDDGAWDSVVAAFKRAGLTEADALLQARVARICRHTDYDYQRKEVKLWVPPSPPKTRA